MRQLTAYKKALELTQNRYDSGVAGKTDVLQAETQLKSTQAQLIDLGVQRAQLEHAIARAHRETGLGLLPCGYAT